MVKQFLYYYFEGNGITKSIINNEPLYKKSQRIIKKFDKLAIKEWNGYESTLVSTVFQKWVRFCIINNTLIKKFPELKSGKWFGQMFFWILFSNFRAFELANILSEWPKNVLRKGTFLGERGVMINKSSQGSMPPDPPPSLLVKEIGQYLS